MTTTRTLTAAAAGPTDLVAKLGSYSLTVITEDRAHGEVTISTNDDEGPSADAVRAATLSTSGSRLTVAFPRNAGSMTIVQSGGFQSVNFSGGAGVVVSGGGIFVSGNNFGDITVNGRLIAGGVHSVSPVTIVARLPHDSNIDVESVSGDVEARGRYARVDASTTSGDIEVEATYHADARTISGDIRIDSVTGRGRLNTVSGDVAVQGPKSASCSARTISGDIRATGGIDVDASTVSGRMRNR